MEAKFFDANIGVGVTVEIDEKDAGY